MKKLLAALIALVMLFAPAPFLVIMTGHNFKSEQTEVVARVLPTLVQVGTSPKGVSKIRTVGSGVIVSPMGWVLTAKHNISDAARVYVKLNDGMPFRVDYYVADAGRDLALLHFSPIVVEPFVTDEGLVVEKPRYVTLSAIRIRRAPAVVGENVLAFGFPAPDMLQGLSATVSHGVVSGVDRKVLEPTSDTAEPETKSNPKLTWDLDLALSLSELLEGEQPVFVDDMVQIDAMINPGSSGGAITDEQGRLIGIANSMLSNTGSSIGLNLIIPILDVDELIAGAGITVITE